MNESCCAGQLLGASMADEPVFDDLYFSAADGLRLHVKAWRSIADNDGAKPVVCLPGLARTADDFDAVASDIVTGRNCAPRSVYALNYRGRGKSDWDPNWRNYDMRIENADILTVLTALDVAEANVLGTSRGGLHIMMLAATRPGLMHRIILNDIGPVLEAKGLARIRGYVGKLPKPRSWDDAVDMSKHIMSAHFSGLSNEEWMSYAKLTFEEKDGVFATRYDPKLSNVLSGIDLTVALPSAWPQFNALSSIPILAIRGENSDLLSAETLLQMQSVHPACEAFVVPGQGHAPLLLDETTRARIVRFIAEGD